MTHDFFSTDTGRIPSGSNGQFVLKGLHSENNAFVTGELTYDIQSDITGMGDPITAQAAASMLDKWEKASFGIDETCVDFGKETLLFLLSQAGCEGIRFYFCKNHNDSISLILIGLNEKGIELNCENIGDNGRKQPLIVEVGGGKKKTDMAQDIGSDEPKCLLYKYYDSVKEKP
jgi:hypothetical protein